MKLLNIEGITYPVSKLPVTWRFTNTGSTPLPVLLSGIRAKKDYYYPHECSLQQGKEALQLCCKGNNTMHKGGCNVSHLSEREKAIAKTCFYFVQKGVSLVWGPLNFIPDAGVTKSFHKISRD